MAYNRLLGGELTMRRYVTSPDLRGDQYVQKYAIHGIDTLVALEYGVVSDSCIEEVSRLKRDAIRPGDLDEMDDFLKTLSYQAPEVSHYDFGVMLAVAAGLHRSGARAYVLRVEKVPVFVASLVKTKEAVAVLCGFGLNVAYEMLTKRALYHCILHLFRQIVTDMTILEYRFAVCHVKNTNEPTLLMWRFLKHKFKNVIINLTNDPFQEGYTLVTIDVQPEKKHVF